jgi:hypothetical protein
MCTDLQMLADGTLVCCRKCTRCRKNRISDWVGRCVAEAKYSTRVVCATLTYRPSKRPGQGSLLIYDDIQKMMKRLRRSRRCLRTGKKLPGYNVRYIVAGEYGSERGRAHWHIILFFRGDSPEFPPENVEKQHWSFWDHGFTMVEPPSAGKYMYYLKYMMKDDASETKVNHFGMSKKPAIGHEWFIDMARQLARERLPLLQWGYSHRDVMGPDGTPFRYWLKSPSIRKDFMETYRWEWFRLWTDDIPETETVMEYDDKVARAEAEAKKAWDMYHGKNPKLVYSPQYVAAWASPCDNYLITRDEYGHVEAHSFERGNTWRVPVATTAEAAEALRGVRPPHRDGRALAEARGYIKRETVTLSYHTVSEELWRSAGQLSRLPGLSEVRPPPRVRRIHCEITHPPFRKETAAIVRERLGRQAERGLPKAKQ